MCACVYRIFFLPSLFPFTCNMGYINKANLISQHLSYRVSGRRVNTRQGLHCLQGKELVSFNDMQSSWQKYNFIVVFICRLSMI